jgi:putative transcriptional regulator
VSLASTRNRESEKSVLDSGRNPMQHRLDLQNAAIDFLRRLARLDPHRAGGGIAAQNARGSERSLAGTVRRLCHRDPAHGPGSGIVNQALTRVADYLGARSAKVIPVLHAGSRFEIGWNMQRLRLKADGRIVELRDGREFPLAPATAVAEPVATSAVPVAPSVAAQEAVPAPAVRDLRRRARLTQLEFASRLGVPVETIRNWEQGKRMPRGPARALLAVIAHAPETVFSALAKA